MSLLAALAFAAVAQAAPPATPPRRIAGTISNSDYPKAALKHSMQGRVVALIAINAKGRVATCAIQRSSGYAVLDKRTCRLVRKRFRFDPARDASGRTVPSRGLLPIDWLLS